MNIKPQYINYDTRTVREWVTFSRFYDPVWQTVMNGAVRMSRVMTGIDKDDFFVGFHVPDGRQLIIHFLSMNFTENFYTLTVERRPDGFDLLEGSLELYKSRLYRTVEPHTVQSQAWVDVAPLGDGEVLQETFVDAGNVQGPGRLASAAQIDDVFIVLREDRVICINRQQGGAPYTFGILVIAWEEGLEV